MSPPSSDRLTVFHLDDERGFRGGERQLLYVASALRAGGHDNVVCCRRASPLEREARHLGFEVLVLPFAFEFDLVSAHRLARAARRRHRPVIHAHTGHTVGIAAACRLFGGPPAIAHRRGASPLRGGFSRWFKYDRVTRVVAVSRAIEEILKRGGLPERHLTVVPDCIPVSTEEWCAAGYATPRFTTAGPERRAGARRSLADRYGVDPAASWVGNLAALVPLKDHATLVAAAGAVVSRRPDTVFLIGGEGPERERLRADIEHRALAGRVVLLGHYDAAELFASIDVFVLSSTREGMGSVLLEAASCGVPVVATAVGGIPEVVRDGQTGLLVAPRDPENLSLAIVRLLDEPDLAKRLAAAARQQLPRFGLAATVRRMEGIYGSAVAPVPATAWALPRATQGRTWRPILAAATLLLLTGTVTMWLGNSPPRARTDRTSVGRANPSRARVAADRTAVSYNGLSFGDGWSDLSAVQMRALMRALDSVQALPSADPDETVALAPGFRRSERPD